jgi:methionyl-tRNA formyltransferase
MDLRIVFMGSPDFAIPTLRALAGSYTITGVVTQPDRPAGRGRQLTPPPVKILAEELGLPVIQPRRLKEPEAMERLRAWSPDLIVVAAFGQILRPEVLDLPQYGCLNVHASLLPRWRGAAPIPAAILHGDELSGVTIMRIDPGLDTGPVLSQRSTPIGPEETAGALSQRLAELGAGLLLETIPGYIQGDISPQPQNDAQSTYAPILKKEDGLLDFTQSAQYLARQVRAYSPWPGSFTFWQGQRLKVLRAHAEVRPSPGSGKACVMGELPAAGAGDGLLVLEEVQPAGKKAMPGDIFINGAKDWEGSLLEPPSEGGLSHRTA